MEYTCRCVWDTGGTTAMKAKSILKVEGLKKSFAGLKAVDDVSFFIETGEILGLIGPNGSGKTTTINIMTGMLDKDEGNRTYTKYFVLSLYL